MKKFVCILLLFSMTCFAGGASAANLNLEKGLVKAAGKSLSLVERALEKQESGRSAKGEITQLKKLAEEIKASNLLFQERLRMHGEKARALGGKAEERQADMAQRYRETVEQLQGLLDSLPDDGSVSPGTLQSLRDLLDRFAPKTEHPLLGSLPYRNLNYPAREPATTPQVVPAYRSATASVASADLQSPPKRPSPPISLLSPNLSTGALWRSTNGSKTTSRQNGTGDA